jgi:hypothetical protein
VIDRRPKVNRMARIDARGGTQRELVERGRRYFPSWQAMAQACGVHPRTLADWRREKHRMSFEALVKLSEQTGMLIPETINVLPEFWHIKRAARLGGLRRYALYGPPGSVESRRRGGCRSIAQFRVEALAGRLGRFQLAIPIRAPERSPALAEFVGIMLGDGCFSSRFQVSVSFNGQTDAEYGRYLRSLFRHLFGLSSTIRVRPGTAEGVVTASSRGLVELLETLGLARGDKVEHQVGVPEWIWCEAAYQSACLRGLMDTDGSVYQYIHRVNGYTYRHVALAFSNRSRPLLDFVERLLRTFELRPRRRRYQVCLYRKADIARYFQAVGTSNLKHEQRYNAFIAK